MNHQEKILALLSKNETKIGKVYDVISEKITDMGSFWRKLSREEFSHAAWIDSFYDEIGKKDAVFDEYRFNTSSLYSFSNFLDRELDFFKNNNFDKSKALSFAFKTERSLIESEFFKIIKTDAMDLKELLEKLKRSTQEHLRSVEEEINKIKKGV